MLAFPSLNDSSTSGTSDNGLPILWEHSISIFTLLCLFSSAKTSIVFCLIGYISWCCSVLPVWWVRTQSTRKVCAVLITMQVLSGQKCSLRSTCRLVYCSNVFCSSHATYTCWLKPLFAGRDLKNGFWREKNYVLMSLFPSSMIRYVFFFYKFSHLKVTAFMPLIFPYNEQAARWMVHRVHF